MLETQIGTDAHTYTCVRAHMHKPHTLTHTESHRRVYNCQHQQCRVPSYGVRTNIYIYTVDTYIHGQHIIIFIFSLQRQGMLK